MFKILQLNENNVFQGYQKEGSTDLAANENDDGVLRITDINQAFNEAAAISENTPNRVCIELEI